MDNEVAKVGYILFPGNLVHADNQAVLIRIPLNAADIDQLVDARD